MTRLYAALAALLAVALLASAAALAFWPRGGDPFAQCRSGVVAGGAGAIGGPFTLVDAHGRTVTDAEVFTRPALVYFGYTFCPDVCPFDVLRNAEAVDILAELGHAVTPVFITVDPARDTPEVLADFAANMHPRMIALTGTPEQVRAAAQAYRVYFRAQEGDPQFYLVDHSTFTYLVLPQVGFVEFFRRDLAPDSMAQRVACFLEAA
jgi:protein SCO1/2